MAELHTAATQALEKMRGVFSGAEEASGALTSLEETSETTAAGIQTELEALKTQVHEVLEAARAERLQLVADGHAIAESLGHVRDEVVTFHEGATAAIETSKEGVDEVAASVAEIEPAIDKLMEDLRASVAAVKEQAQEVESELEEVTVDASDLLNADMATELDGWREALEEHVSAVQAYVQDTCLPEILTAKKRLAEQLSEFQQQLATRLETAAEEAKTMAISTLETCARENSRLIDALYKLHERLNEIMIVLEKAMKTGGVLVQAGMEATDQGVAMTSVGLNTAIGAIRETLEMLSKMSFVKL